MNDHPTPEVQAVTTVGGVLTDLVEVAERLPVPADQAEATARILDRLAEEITEAASMLRGVHLKAAPGESFASDERVMRARRLTEGFAADERVTRARRLLAEHHQPLVMTPGDVKHLLSRFQRAAVELLAVVDGTGGGSSR